MKNSKKVAIAGLAAFAAAVALVASSPQDALAAVNKTTAKWCAGEPGGKEWCIDVNGNMTPSAAGQRIGDGTTSPKQNHGRNAAQSAVEESTSVAVSASYIVLASSGGAVQLESTPNISTATASAGDWLCLGGTSDTNTVELQDEANLTDSALQLAGDTNITLGNRDKICLIYDSGDSQWHEVSRSNN